MQGIAGVHFLPISIHALREEGDVRATPTDSMTWISIHALREEGDRMACCTASRLSTFLSTPSARRATWSCRS